jgi:hypothetical protein
MTIRDFFIFAGMTTSSRQDEKQKNNIYIYIYIYNEIECFSRRRVTRSILVLTYLQGEKAFYFFLHRVGFFFRVSIEPEILTVHVANQRNLKNMNLSMYA